MIAALESETDEFVEVIGFRGSSKTTWGSLILPIFLALERHEPFIIIGADTTLQSGTNISNIKYELENNDLLKQDYGTLAIKAIDDPVPEPTFESDEEWQARNLLLSNDVRILARSRGQKIRGLKHRQYRPRVVIIDDPEDIKWVEKKENRDATASPMADASWRPGSAITTTTGHTRHWPIVRRLSSQLYAAVDMTAINPPWKTLRVYHISTARLRLAVILPTPRSQGPCLRPSLELH